MQSFCQMDDTDAERVLLPGAVDFKKADTIELLQHLDIFIEQPPGARIELRLERDTNAPGLSRQFRGFNAGPQFRRVLCIIIEPADAVNFSAHEAPPRHAGEVRIAA